MILKLPKEYTVEKVNNEFQYLDSKGRPVFISSRDNTAARFEVWEHYYRNLNTAYLNFYEIERDDNNRLIYVLITIGLLNLSIGIINLIQQNQLFNYIFGG